MEAKKNYIPFEYYIQSCPSFLYIPCNDKSNYIHYRGGRTGYAVKTFLQKVLQDPEFVLKEQQKPNFHSGCLRKIVQVKRNFEVDYYEELPQFLKEHFNGVFQIAYARVLARNYRYIFIVMDFPNMKCQAHHIDWLNKIFPVARRQSLYIFLIADFKHINIINTKWNPDEIRASEKGKPKIFAIDYLGHSFEIKNVDTASSLFYSLSNIDNQHYYYSQVYLKSYLQQSVKVWTADYFYIGHMKTPKNIFLTFYSSDAKDSDKILDLLQFIADNVKQLNIEVAKYDVKLNYVDLEFAQENYPAHYFIKKYSKNRSVYGSAEFYNVNRDNILYTDEYLNREKILEFIKNNIRDN